MQSFLFLRGESIKNPFTSMRRILRLRRKNVVELSGTSNVVVQAHTENLCLYVYLVLCSPVVLFRDYCGISFVEKIVLGLKHWTFMSA